MEVIIRYSSGRRIEGVVLAVGKDGMRVAPRNQDDAIELSLNYGQWMDENGCPIEFESFVASDRDLHGVLAELRQLSRGGGA